MVQVPRRTGFSGPTLVRLLARLTDVDVPESPLSLSDRLSQWLGWTDAIALSGVLDGTPPSVAAGAQAWGDAEESECARVRTTLAKAIANDGAFAASRRRQQARPSQEPPRDTQVDYVIYRQRYLSMQRTMETAIAKLRGRLRNMLATRSPDMTRLAMIDAVMEHALSVREHTLLATVPGLLQGHFERLRQSGQATPPDGQASGTAPAATSAAWLDVFRRDMRSVLLAELDIRLQPVEGLLAALRASQPGSHG
jgi:hypothetical protein